jgi:hypothetical protein
MMVIYSFRVPPTPVRRNTPALDGTALVFLDGCDASAVSQVIVASTKNSVIINRRRASRLSVDDRAADDAALLPVLTMPDGLASLLLLADGR